MKNNTSEPVFNDYGILKYKKTHTILRTWDNHKRRHIIKVPSSGKSCGFCRKPFKSKERCIREEKSNKVVGHICFQCYDTQFKGNQNSALS